MRKRWGRRPRGSGLGLSGMYPLLVLLMISKGYKYGYEIEERIEDLISAPMPSGFIYVTLSRLERSGFVISAPVPLDPRGKKVYRLTPAGEQYLINGISQLRETKILIDRILDFYEGNEF